MPLIVNSELALEWKSAVLLASRRSEVITAVRRIYSELQSRIEIRRPICVASGKCCHFERYGHRLYVSTMELAAFTAALGESYAGSGREAGVWEGTGCPFQIGKLCGVHGFRPFGCRVFFCDATATAWQQEQYEQFHGQLRKLHDELEVPYFYLEWRAALKAAGLLSPGAKSF